MADREPYFRSPPQFEQRLTICYPPTRFEWFIVLRSQCNAMRTHAKTDIMGRLGKDPSYRVTDTGLQVVELSIATHDQRKRNGQFEEITFWHTIEAYGNLAEEVHRAFRKGDMIQVDGKIVYRDWNDKATGQKRIRTVFVMSSFTAIDPRPLAGGMIDTDPGIYASQSSGVAGQDRPF